MIDGRPARAGHDPGHGDAGPAQGGYAAFQPSSATAMGYDDLKVIEAYNFLRSVAEGTAHGATLGDAVCSAAALDAMLSSASRGAWVGLAEAS